MAYFLSRRLRGNRRLSDIHPDAFMGLASLRRLDLSQTAITNLPVRGLSELETLELIETRTLKEIPSVYNYKVNKSLQSPTIRVSFCQGPYRWGQMDFSQIWIVIRIWVGPCNHYTGIDSLRIFSRNFVPIDIRRNSSCISIT